MIAQKRYRRSQRRPGFTLMEMLVVVAIIVVLAGIGGYYLLPRVDEAKIKAGKAQLQIITSALETYKLNNGDYPPSLESLAAPQGELGKPIMELDALKDPWGRPYNYDPSGAENKQMKADVWFTGPNNQRYGNWTRETK